MISIILPAYNLLDLTKKAVYSINKYTADIEHELICIDDGSEDGTYEYFKTITDKIVHSNTRQGFSYSCNKGLELSSKDSEFITIINNDYFVGPKWLSNLINTYNVLISKNINVWCVCSKLVYGSFSEETFVQECSNYINAVSYPLTYVATVTEIFPSIIPKKLIEKYGLFDPEYYQGIFWEDVDLHYKYKKEGYVSYCSPNSRVFHFGHSSTAFKLINIHELHARNKAIFERKWGIKP
jgi:GT2 family glycosyltransferase